MNRRDLVLAILAAAGDREYQPVQIQKAVFLVSENIGDVVTEGRGFAFQPYDYGPFDAAVYTEIELLKKLGLAEIRPSALGRWKTYSATEGGVLEGQRVLGSLSPEHREYIESVSKWVRSLGFGALVKSVYEAHPEMRENSIFKY